MAFLFVRCLIKKWFINLYEIAKNFNSICIAFRKGDNYNVNCEILSIDKVGGIE